MPKIRSTMRYFSLILLTVSGLVLAQTSSHENTIEKRTERIHVEDGGARIDELRVGGETQAITVQPKSSMPAYQIAPHTGERSWKVLAF